jgi:hypothetical protein
MAIAFFGYLDRLGSCMLVVAAVTALCGKPLDALAPLAVLTWAREGWTLTSIGLTVAYANWAQHSFRTNLVPDFETFLARLQPSPFATKILREAGERGCIVCWTTEETLLRLPCHVRHILCRNCLVQLHDADMFSCPHCRRGLFVYEPHRRRILFRYLITTGIVITLVFRALLLALQLSKGYYREAIKSVVGTVGFGLFAWYALLRLPSERYLANMHMWVLWCMLASTAYSVWSSAAIARHWDQVTLWDGAVLKGVEVWDTHKVVRDWYGAAE